MRIVSLSGWGQPHDALQELMPQSEAIAYAHHVSAAEALKDIAAQAQGAELAIGWSLGGQMLVRAIAAGMLNVKKLVLIATPFQFVARPDARIGMPADLFRMFYDNYAADRERTLAKAWISIAKGDSHGAAIHRHLEQQDKEAVLAGNWLGWLDTLKNFSCADIRLAQMPPTLLIHGRKDAVVYYEQSDAFLDTLPQAKRVTFDSSGHAPHWHDAQAVRNIITEFAHG